jgi:SMC interacting uncharacterized protein involved in chromosome segregation
VEKSEREKEELTMELGQLKEQNETLTCALKEQQQEIDHLKVCLHVFSFHKQLYF